MNKRNMVKGIVCIFMAMLMLASGCKTNAVDTENSVLEETSALASASESTETTTETAVITVTLVETTKAVPTPTVKETTVASTASPTTVATTAAPAATTKAPAATTKAPAATTKAPAATTKAPAATTAAPPVETAPPVVTTAAPATDYTAVCADIRSKLIAILEANGKWDPNFAGTVVSWGQKWWEVGYFKDYDMSTQDVADEYYIGKFGGTISACGIDCYVADGKIYLDYQGY